MGGDSQHAALQLLAPQEPCRAELAIDRLPGEEPCVLRLHLHRMNRQFSAVVPLDHDYLE